MAPTPVSEIPSLALLYKLHKLHKLGPSRLPLVAGASPMHNDRIGLVRGDITQLAVGAIVNAANTSLMGGGGVDGAIHRAAGRGLLAECAMLGGCDTGSAKMTGAYGLPCDKVIHAVGPVYNDAHPQRSEEQLASCYTTALGLAVRHGVRTVAFSGISTGIYGYPSMDAAMVACSAVKTFLETADGKGGIDKVVFVTFEEKDVRAYNTVLPRFFPPGEIANETQNQEDKAAETTAQQLPSVPTTDPVEVELPAPKKQRHDGGDA
ncbi:O-acetyl-ADP-ribose deacetylase [Microdochium nivale]|nr:O-acetyl-ADP-ribose deacetylase [Microdochium nivale]